MMQQAGAISHGPPAVMTMFFPLPVDTSSMYAEAEKLEREAAQLKVRAQLLKQSECRQASEEGISTDSGQETEEDLTSQCGWRSRSTSPVPCRPARWADIEP